MLTMVIGPVRGVSMSELSKSATEALIPKVLKKIVLVSLQKSEKTFSLLFKKLLELNVTKRI